MTETGPMELRPIEGAGQDVSENGLAQPPKGYITDEEGEAMAEAALTLFRRWRLTDAEARVLLGGIGQSTLTRWKRGEIGRLGTDVKTRLSILMGVHASLRTMFIENERAYGWIRAENDDLGGLRPLDVMLGGQITDLYRVRDYVGALVHGGW